MNNIIVKCTTSSYQTIDKHKCVKYITEINNKINNDELELTYDLMMLIISNISSYCIIQDKAHNTNYNIFNNMFINLIEKYYNTNKEYIINLFLHSNIKYNLIDFKIDILNKLINKNNDNITISYINIFYEIENKCYCNNINKFIILTNDIIEYNKIIEKKDIGNINLNNILLIIYKNIIKNENFINKNNNCYHNYVTKENSKNLYNILEYLYTCKTFYPTYDVFMNAFIYDTYDNAIKLIKKSNDKLNEKSANDFIMLLVNNTTLEHDIKIDDILDLLFENKSDLKYIDLDNIINCIIKDDIYLKKKYLCYDYRFNNINNIINYFVNKKCKMSIDNFIKMTKLKIHIKNPSNCGIDINNSEIKKILFNNNFNPYNIKFDITLDLLQNECEKPANTKKIKEICKKINPDVKCLENACKIRNNKSVINYLLNDKNIIPNIQCIVNYIGYSYGASGYYICNNYVNKLNNQKTPIKSYVKEGSKEIEKINDFIELPTEIYELINNKDKYDENDDNNSVYSEKSDLSSKKKIIKKIIKKVVKKKNDTDNTDNTTETSDTKPKKIIRKVVKKVNTDNTDNIDNIDNIDNTTETSDTKPKKIIKNNLKPFNINDYNISDRYNYKNKYKVKEDIKKLLNTKENEMYHINLRRLLLEYLKEKEILKQNMNILNIDFEIKDIDKLVCYFMDMN